MSGRDDLLLAVPAAIGAAGCFGLTAVLQHRATKQITRRRAMRPRLILDLVHRPVWLVSLIANIFGTALQVLALRFGPLILVQPLLVTGLLFTVVIGAIAAGRRPDRVLLSGAACCVVGVAVFLLVARPAPGAETLSLVSMVPLVFVLGGLLAACLMASSRGHGLVPALALALAAGVLYGVTAGFIKVVTVQFSVAPYAPLQSWTMYAVCAIGPLGFLLSQNAYQASKAASPILAVITTVDPLVGIVVGRLWLGEHVSLGIGAVAGEVIGLAIMTTGIWLLAHRAPHLRGGDDAAVLQAGAGSRRTGGNGAARAAS